MRFIFDMDGTIVDSYAAVRAAYLRAGVKPAVLNENWGKSWREWCDEDKHKEKVRMYPNFLREKARTLPQMHLLRMVQGEVLTSASHEAVLAVREFTRCHFPAQWEMTAEDKLTALYIASSGDSVMYFDDDLDFGLRAAREIRGLTFVHVTEQEGMCNVYDILNKKVLRWTLSSWRQGETKDFEG